MGKIRDHYVYLNGPRSMLGYPVGEQLTAADGALHGRFQYGVIYYTPATGAHELYADILTKWNAMNADGSCGYPMSDETTPGGSGLFSDFQRGSIYWSPATGAHWLTGAIRDKYRSIPGAVAALGYPTTDETRVVLGSRLYRRRRPQKRPQGPSFVQRVQRWRLRAELLPVAADVLLLLRRHVRLLLLYRLYAEPGLDETRGLRIV